MTVPSLFIADADDVYVAQSLLAHDHPEQVGSDPSLRVADDQCRVSELLDRHWMVQVRDVSLSPDETIGRPRAR
jgi:hypothetical protein